MNLPCKSWATMGFSLSKRKKNMPFSLVILLATRAAELNDLLVYEECCHSSSTIPNRGACAVHWALPCHGPDDEVLHRGMYAGLLVDSVLLNFNTPFTKVDWSQCSMTLPREQFSLLCFFVECLQSPSTYEICNWVERFFVLV